MIISGWGTIAREGGCSDGWKGKSRQERIRYPHTAADAYMRGYELGKEAKERAREEERRKEEMERSVQGPPAAPSGR